MAVPPESQEPWQAVIFTAIEAFIVSSLVLFALYSAVRWVFKRRGNSTHLRVIYQGQERELDDDRIQEGSNEMAEPVESQSGQESVQVELVTARPTEQYITLLDTRGGGTGIKMKRNVENGTEAESQEKVKTNEVISEEKVFEIVDEVNPIKGNIHTWDEACHEDQADKKHFPPMNFYVRDQAAYEIQIEDQQGDQDVPMISYKETREDSLPYDMEEIDEYTGVVEDGSLRGTCEEALDVLSQGDISAVSASETEPEVDVVFEDIPEIDTAHTWHHGVEYNDGQDEMVDVEALVSAPGMDTMFTLNDAVLVASMPCDGGDSLFAALAHQLYEPLIGSADHWQHTAGLRTAAVRHLRYNKLNYWDQLVEATLGHGDRCVPRLEQEIVQRYLEELSLPGFPGGPECIAAVADMLGVDVLVYVENLALYPVCTSRGPPLKRVAVAKRADKVPHIYDSVVSTSSGHTYISQPHWT